MSRCTKRRKQRLGANARDEFTTVDQVRPTALHRLDGRSVFLGVSRAYIG